MRTFHIAAAFLVIAAVASSAEPSIRCIEPNAATGTSRAVVVGNVPLVHTSQVLPIKDSHRIAGKAELQALRVLSGWNNWNRRIYRNRKLNVRQHERQAARSERRHTFVARHSRRQPVVTRQTNNTGGHGCGGRCREGEPDGVAFLRLGEIDERQNASRRALLERVEMTPARFLPAARSSSPARRRKPTT
jgi:hypothetical protein